jgi:LPXTG-motif cell wall-anchored protein
MKRVVIFLLAAGLVLVGAIPALAAPPSSDPNTDARAAGAWIAGQVNGSGFIPQAANPANPNLSVTVQAVIALAATGVGRSQVDALLGYLGSHVDDVVVVGGADDPGALGYLILAAKAGGQNPAAFGPAAVDLVARLVATQQPSGLFGTSAPTYDGAFRQGLALIALKSAGVTNAAGVAWLEAQQCADGAFTAFRSDTNVACPAVDPATFSGPDTNSTAFAALGLQVQGATTGAAHAVTALNAARNADGGWGYLGRSDQTTDANSTGLVLDAMRTVNGTVDRAGRNALLELQVGCTGDRADQGGIAFQPGAGGSLTPDAYATVQAAPALAGVAWPITAGEIATEVPDPCPPATTTTTAAPTTTTVAASGTTVANSGSTVTASSTTIAAKVNAAAELPRTGTASGPFALVAVCLLAVGLLFVGGARRRQS